LGFVFWLGDFNEGVPDYPRTVMLLSIFSDAFPFFIFLSFFSIRVKPCSGPADTVCFINDSLPPPNWVLNGSRLIFADVAQRGLSFLQWW